MSGICCKNVKSYTLTDDLDRPGARISLKKYFPGSFRLMAFGVQSSGLAATQSQLQDFLASNRLSSKVRHLKKNLRRKINT
jgi:hypothetical protein